jgi:hypothetical protein
MKRYTASVVKILISRLSIFTLFLFLLMSVRFQVSVFSEASGRRDDQFDQKTDYSVAESDTRICYCVFLS